MANHLQDNAPGQRGANNLHFESNKDSIGYWFRHAYAIGKSTNVYFDNLLDEFE